MVRMLPKEMKKFGIGVWSIIIISFQVGNSVKSGWFQMEGVSRWFVENFCKKVGICIPVLSKKRLSADHGPIGVSGVQVIVIAVSDVFTEFADNDVMVGSIQTRTGNQIFFRDFLKLDILTAVGYFRGFA